MIVRLEMLCTCTKYAYSPSKGTWSLALRGTTTTPPLPVAGDRVEYRLVDALITLTTSPGGGSPLRHRAPLQMATVRLTPQLGSTVRVDVSTVSDEGGLDAEEQEILAEELALVLEAVVDDPEEAAP